MADIGFQRYSEIQADNRSDLMILLLIAAGPLVFGLLQATYMSLIVTAIQFAILALAIFSLAKGAAVKRRYDERAISRAPKIPGLLLGSFLVGVFAAVVAMGEMSTIKIPLILGLIAMGLSICAFGVDPLRKKGFDNPELMAQRKLYKTLLVTDAKMRKLIDRVAVFKEPDLQIRVEAMHGSVLRILRSSAQIPEGIYKIEQPLQKVMELTETEVDALERSWRHESHTAANRFTKRLQALNGAFENFVRATRVKHGDSEFDFDADMLIDRMMDQGA